MRATGARRRPTSKLGSYCPGAGVAAAALAAWRAAARRAACCCCAAVPSSSKPRARWTSCARRGVHSEGGGAVASKRCVRLVVPSSRASACASAASSSLFSFASRSSAVCGCAMLSYSRASPPSLEPRWPLRTQLLWTAACTVSFTKQIALFSFFVMCSTDNGLATFSLSSSGLRGERAALRVWNRAAAGPVMFNRSISNSELEP